MDRFAEIETRMNAVDTAKSPVKAVEALLAQFPEDYIWLIDEVHKARKEASKLQSELSSIRSSLAPLIDRVLDSVRPILEEAYAQGTEGHIMVRDILSFCGETIRSAANSARAELQKEAP